MVSRFNLLLLANAIGYSLSLPTKVGCLNITHTFGCMQRAAVVQLYQLRVGWVDPGTNPCSGFDWESRVACNRNGDVIGMY
jgi:hypothetical protein